MMQNKSYVIAITGGIASGKSTVAKHLQSKGYNVIDADMISHELTKDGSPLLDEISCLFGSQYVKNRVLDRKALGNLIFSDQNARLRLNQLLHPLIYSQIAERIDDCDSSIVFIDIPLVFEYHFKDLIDEIWNIDIPVKEQIRRLMIRNCITYDDAKNRIHSQISRKKRRELSDVTIMNTGSVEKLLKKVDTLLEKKGIENKD